MSPQISKSRSGRCAFISAVVLALVVVIAARAQDELGGDTDEASATSVLEVLRQDPAERSGELADRGPLLRAGYDAFMASMASFEGELAVALARELFAEDPAIWSAFCLEGALRRSAPGAAGAESLPFLEALGALQGLRELNASDPGARVDLTNRIAILAAGFGARAIERAALGRSLAAGGVDGAQITGLAALGHDPAVAARLFGSLLDRRDDESVRAPSSIDILSSLDIPPEAAPWALRGHALASLEWLRGSSVQD